jgi:O-antigen ligase
VFISVTQLHRTALYLALASAVAILLSITLSQTLLALSLIALLASRQPLRLPPIRLPLGLFLAGTLLSMAFSPEPAHGLPQVKKIFVFSTLLVVYSTLRDTAIARRLFLVCGGAGALGAMIAVGQFIHKWRVAQAQHRIFYEAYVDSRITGTMSHWMTFAGQQMIVLLMLAAFLFFARVGRPAWFAWAGCACLLAVAELLNETRTVWLGVAVGGAWLLWGWKRWLAVAAPAAVVLLLWLVPGPIHDRFVSIFHPNRKLDSNEFRLIAFKTGFRMIRAHPLLGIGLDETKYHFKDYLPPDAPNPLPDGFYQHLHNFYLQFAAERGIPTLLMLLWMLGRMLRDFYRALQKLPPGPGDERFLLQGGIAAVLGVMVSGLFEVNLGDTEVLTIFLVVAACGYVAFDRARSEPRPSGSA